MLRNELFVRLSIFELRFCEVLTAKQFKFWMFVVFCFLNMSLLCLVFCFPCIFSVMQSFFEFLQVSFVCRGIGITEALSKLLRDWRRLLSLVEVLSGFCCWEDGCLCLKKLTSYWQLHLKINRRHLSNMFLLMKEMKIQENSLWWAKTLSFSMPFAGL